MKHHNSQVESLEPRRLWGRNTRLGEEGAPPQPTLTIKSVIRFDFSLNSRVATDEAAARGRESEREGRSVLGKEREPEREEAGQGGSE